MVKQHEEDLELYEATLREFIYLQCIQPLRIKRLLQGIVVHA